MNNKPQTTQMAAGGEKASSAFSPQQNTTAPGNADSFFVQAPAINLPKGGGAIKSIDEKFSVNAVNGTSSFSIPLPVSAARGFAPALALSYSSGSGNGLFGIGWSLSLASIKRKTERELPQYFDAGNSDTYLFSEAEDLVPEFKRDNDGNLVTDVNGHFVVNEFDFAFAGNNYKIKRYRPRIEGSFSRIERWTDKASGTIHWRVVTPNNMTTVLGKNAGARVADPDDDNRIFKWLPDYIYDDKGNCAIYEYKKEDGAGIDSSRLHNRNRQNGNAPFTNAYIKRIRYGNVTPFIHHDDPLPVQFLFETVFDYGEHDAVNLPYNEIRNWTFRDDAFSDYRAGFEIRTCRLCKRILLFHHFAELPGGSALVKSLDIQYSDNGEEGFTFLTAVTQTGYAKHDDGTYTQKSFPPFVFDYQKHEWNEEVKIITQENLVHTPAGIDNSHYLNLDLYNEGLAGILSEQEGAWFYKSNLGEGNFSEARPVAPKPSFNGLSQLQLTDLEANGTRQVVNWHGEPKGFFELNAEEEEWQPFVAFENVPLINFSDPNIRLLDIDGDGLADVLLTEQDVFTWYPSKGKEGYGASRNIVKSLDEEKGPAIVFADGTQTIFLADMNGDGLADIVRIRNGEVCYWPHTGYGKFGAKVSMDNAPVFDHPDQFNPSLIKLADIDGSGTTDIIYYGQNKFRIWLNHHGNSFITQPKVIEGFPETDNHSTIIVTDLLATGMACIVWNSALPEHLNAPLRYIDLMNSKKPHIMTAYKNNLGKEVLLEYTPSTKFYIQDKLAGKPWVTKLHFPIHCLSKVIMHDRILKMRFASEYSYHHGYYDHQEKEFRGFGRVDQKDTEDIDHFIKQNNIANNVVEQDLHQPPVVTKTWYHTGAFLNRKRILNQFANEYFQNTVVPENLLPEPDLPADLTTDEYREALRTCKGMLLRKEVYALDDDEAKKDLPYVVEQHSCLIKVIQPKEKNKYGVFLSHDSESITYHYERDPSDPRIAHRLVFDIDKFGNELQNASVVYARQPHVDNEPEQNEMHIILTEIIFTNPISGDLDYRTPLNHFTRTYEVTGITKPAHYFSLNDLKTDCNAAAFIDYEVSAGAGKQKRLIEFVRSQYRGDDGTTILPFGTIQSKGLAHQSYKAAFNQNMLTAVFGVKMALPALQAVLVDNSKGAYLFADNYFWISSGTKNYDTGHFYLSTEYTNPFGKKTQAQYDPNYFLFVKNITDALNNKTEVKGFNYRLLSAYLSQDNNDNLSAARFDELGMVIKTFVIGKKGIDQGDEFDDSKVEIKNASDFPSVEIEYHLSEWFNQTQSGGFDIDNYKPQPAFVKIKTRETHYHAHPQHVTKFQEAYTYSDGSARVVLSKVQAEPGAALQVNPDGTVTTVPDTSPNLRWVGNGRKIFNNKGNPVKQYEPYFSVSPVFDTEKEMVELGVTSVIHYDPVGRAIRTDLPDKTFTKVEFTPWLQRNFDNNDTVKDSAWYSDRGSPDPSGAEPADPDVRAAWMAAKHYNTPVITHLDTLGRNMLSVVTDGVDEIKTRTVYDIENNQLKAIDGLNRTVMQYEYDMLGNKLKQMSPDAGNRWVISNVSLKPILSWDDRNHQLNFEYDDLGRIVSSGVQEGNAAVIVYGKTEYGESLPLAISKTNNLRGIMHTQYDQSGLLVNIKNDFKGNMLQCTKQLVNDYKNIINWSNTGAVVTDPDVYESSTEYDALNRPVKLTSPHTATMQATEFYPTYNEAGLLDKLELAIREAVNKTVFVSNINYNAKAQREEIFYGNATKTKYTYDKNTFRLTNLLTTRNNGNTILQNLFYTFDPVGNITTIRDDADEAVKKQIVFDGENVQGINKYAYDALYRLTLASGRKHAGQTDINHTKADFNYRNHPFVNSGTINSNDVQAFRNYTEQYSYDKAGNLAEQQHISKNSSWTRTFEYTNGNNQLTKTTIGAFTRSYTYDAHGNIDAMEQLQHMTWNYVDQLKEVDLGGGGKAYYVYDANGQRVRKVIERPDGTKKERIYLTGLEIYRERNNTNNITLERETLQVMDDKRRIAMIDTPLVKPAGNQETQLTRYNYDNHLGSASLELDDTAKIISYEEYFPYGSTSYAMVDATREISAKRYRYTGKERDEESGLNYHGMRYYAPWLCRWTAADPIGIKDGLNMYVFGADNPIIFTDPNGTEVRLSVDQDAHTINYSTTVHFFGTAAEIRKLKPVAAKAEKFFSNPNIETESDTTARFNRTPYVKRRAEFTDDSGVTWTVRYNVHYEFHDTSKQPLPRDIQWLYNPPAGLTLEDVNARIAGGKRDLARYGFKEGDNVMILTPAAGSVGGVTSLFSNPSNARMPTFGEPINRMIAQIANKSPDYFYESMIHETGHLLGFDERYTDFGGLSSNHHGFRHDFMGAASGVTDKTFHPEHIATAARFGIAVANYRNLINQPITGIQMDSTGSKGRIEQFDDAGATRPAYTARQSTLARELIPHFSSSVYGFLPARLIPIDLSDYGPRARLVYKHGSGYHIESD